MTYWWIAPLKLYIDRQKELINQSTNKKKFQNCKLIGKSLLTVTVVHLKQFTPKDKQVTYTETIFKLYN